ncbi:uncharacterized protein LOC144446858 [Glandiceps talaboti]
MADQQSTEVHRSVRQRHMPAYLEDYYLGDNVNYASPVDKPATQWDRLIKERGLIIGDIHRNCDKANKLVSECGSRTILRKIDSRLEKNLSDLKGLTDTLLNLAEKSESPPEEIYQVTQCFTVTRALVEDCQDVREQKQSQQLDLLALHTVQAKQEDENSEHASVASDASMKSVKAKIKVEVATLRVKQEKERCKDECHLREEQQRLRDAEHQLKIQKQRDEVDRVALEAELWDEFNYTHNPVSQIRPGLPIDKVVRGTTQPEIRPTRHTGPIGSSSPIEKHLETLFPTPKRRSDTPYNRMSDDNMGNVNRFFQGIAKPSLPKFNGDKAQFQDWREQFEVFVNQVEMPVRFKMVMLKNSLTGQPLQLVSRLGYTDHQYKMALTKLEQRYGGERRQLQHHLNALIALPTVREDNLKGLEDLTNRLCDTVAKLADSGHEAELVGTSTLYTLVLQKVPDSLLIQYYDTRPRTREDGLSAFVDWLNQQVCIRLELAEIKEKPRKSQIEPSKSSTGYRKPQSSNTHSSEATPTHSGKSKTNPNSSSGMPTSTPTTELSCPLCKEAHHVVKCEQWNSISVDERWKLAKEKGLCYRCLKANHRGRNCHDASKCEIDGCVRTHHKHLHKSATPKEVTTVTDSAHNAFGVLKDGKVIPTKVALRLVPVYVIGKDGQKQMVNAFLDDGSDSTYIRSDIAAALKLEVENNELTVSTMVNQGTKINSGLVAVTIESLDGQTRRTVGARTLDTMCENLTIPNWHNHHKKWMHLEGLDFPKLPGRKTVDILIGADHPELTLSLEERSGQDNGLDEALRNLWNLDAWETKIEDVLTADEQLATTKTVKSLKRINNRYEVAIPWRDEQPDLPDNRRLAENRLISLERALSKKPILAARYKEVMEANIRKGYFEKVNDSVENLGPSWYLPHFPVVREDKATTKVRIVYDSAAKSEGVCLNDMMLPGPKLQLDVVDVLLRFRRRRVAIVGDIKEMFSQVVMAKEDRPFHRILWRNLDLGRPIEVYEATRLTFGDRASPYLAQYVVRTHAETNCQEFPLAATVCTESMYMDDVMDSQDSDDEAIQVREQLTSLLSKAGFHIRRWCSNSTLVLEGVPEEERATGVKEAWILGLGWDDEFPPDLSSQTTQWFSELPLVSEMAIPRCYQHYPTEDTSLHTFTDASSQAFGAVTYLRSVYGDGSVSVRFVVARAKVAPLKAVSIPRLELMAALLGLRLAARVSTTLGMPLSQHVFWSDSMDVIHWIRGQSRKYKPFVAHRIAEIQSKTNPSQWNHVPGKINPADLATRGVRMQELIDGSPWMDGPEFLYGGEHTWPSTPVTEFIHTGDALNDMSKTCTQVVDTSADSECKFPIDCNRFSIWSRLIRTTAWVLRFIKLIKAKNQATKLQPNLNITEIQVAEKLWIKQIQMEKFADTITSLEKGQQTKIGPLKSLLPFLDDEGILRVGGRLQNSDLPYNAKHPILIPCRNHIATLIVRHYHSNIGKHAKGVNATLAETRQRFWIVHGREEVKRVHSDCKPCHRRRKKVAEQIMAPLPYHRITVPIRAFARSGVDYAGPFYTKLRRRVVAKRYLCLFTCTTSRAVHLEPAYSMDTDSFLNAFSI